MTDKQLKLHNVFCLNFILFKLFCSSTTFALNFVIAAPIPPVYDLPSVDPSDPTVQICTSTTGKDFFARRLITAPTHFGMCLALAA
jgi:hypothetical protein